MAHQQLEPGQAQAFLATLTPQRTTTFDAKWEWIGRTAILRIKGRGTFTLNIWTGGTHGHVAGLDGTFTSDAGTQEHITFRFEDFLVSSNPRNHHAYRPGDRLAVVEHCGWDWYIARPASLAPLHEAIRLWVETYAPSRHLSRAKGTARSITQSWWLSRADVDSDEHMSSPTGCHPDCPACEKGGAS